jgi:hypothetical protein
MSFLALWDYCADRIVYVGLPVVSAYHVLCSSTFLNVSAQDAHGVEKAANIFLSPVQYLLAGQEASPVFSEDGKLISYKLEQRFSYEDPLLWIKTAGAYCALPSSLIVGGALKAASYCFKETRDKYEKISFSLVPFVPQNSMYRSWGIEVVDFEDAEKIVSQGYQRRPGDELKLKAEKEALKEIVSLFHEHKIVYWMDCGTCLGAYRYGGNIPWDWDIDLAILQPDFSNVRQILQKLDSNKYLVQDWSSRDNEQSYLKVYVKETHSMIDIYHFAIDPEQRTVHSILSNEHSIFLPNSWKIRERRYIIPTSFDLVFPLKKANFDGVEAFVPNQTKEYLEQRYYGNISPAKIYSEETGQYEKDLSHPYWQLLYNR